MNDEDTPPELERWLELNKQADKLDEEGQTAQAEALYPDIEAAWYAAPLRVRAAYDWRALKEVVRERWHERSLNKKA